MNKDEALKMAIEALERIDGWLLERNLSGLMPKEKQVLNACKEALEEAEKQEWQSLNADEINYASYGSAESGGFCDGANWACQKLKEKNYG